MFSLNIQHTCEHLFNVLTIRLTGAKTGLVLFTAVSLEPGMVLASYR